MKCNKIIVATLMLAAFVSFAGSAKNKARMTKQKTKLVMDFPGIEEGAGYPKWVSAALKQDRAGIGKALALTDRQVFFFTNKGENLDFLQNWTDNVDMVKEVASSLDRVVENQVDALYKGGTAESKKELSNMTKISSKVRLSGLIKEATFWIKYAAPKTPNAKIKKDMSNADVYYQYYVVYSMDKKTWDKQVNAALGDAELNAKISEFMLKNAAGFPDEIKDAKDVVKAIAKDVKQPLGDEASVALVEDGADEEFSWLDEE